MKTSGHTSVKKTRLRQALTWSLLFHLSLLMIFSITVFFLPSDDTSQPVDVQLEMPDPVAMTSLEVTQKTSIHARDIILESSFIRLDPFSDIAWVAYSSTSQEAHSLMKSYTPSGTPWTCGKLLDLQSSRVYPLKISLQNDLKDLLITQDARTIFIPSTKDTIFYTPILSTLLPYVTFQVTVNTKKGMITVVQCRKPLTDKRSHQLAKNILKELRFQSKIPNVAEELSGDLTLQFSGTFDTLEPLLTKEALAKALLIRNTYD